MLDIKRLEENPSPEQNLKGLTSDVIPFVIINYNSITRFLSVTVTDYSYIIL